MHKLRVAGCLCHGSASQCKPLIFFLQQSGSKASCQILEKGSTMWSLTSLGDMTWACVYIILRVCIHADALPQPVSGQARKEVLKWQPLCICYEVCLLRVSVPLQSSLIAASHRCFKVHLVSLSWLGSFILACLPSSLLVPVPLASVCPDRGVSMVLSYYTVFPKHLYHH